MHVCTTCMYVLQLYEDVLRNFNITLVTMVTLILSLSRYSQHPDQTGAGERSLLQGAVGEALREVRHPGPPVLHQ